MTVLVALSASYSIYKICYSADMLKQIPDALENCINTYNEHPEFFLQTKEQIISSFSNAQVLHTKYIIFETINLILNLALVAFLYIAQFSNKKNRLSKNCILVTASLIILIGIPWLISCVAQNCTDFPDEPIDSRGLLMQRIILDSIAIVLNVCLAILIYIRHFYRKKEQIANN